jgi:hypothetical protein
VVDVAEFVRATGQKLATVTDFTSVDACRELRGLTPSDCLVVMGLEVRVPEGDFLVFSTDEEYLAGLPASLATIRDVRRAEDTAVIWAHPFVDQRAMTYEAPRLPEVRATVPFIDGLELFNGAMLDLNRQHLLRVGYFRNLIRIASDHGLAMTAGSDAHEPSLLGRCTTSYPDAAKDAAGLIGALKRGEVRPHYDYEFFGVRIPLG